MDDRRRPPRLALAAVLLAAAAPSARAQCDTTASARVDIAGQVIDARALVPLPAAVVLTADRDTLAALDADSAGFFAAAICRRPTVVAHFRRIGYRADSIVVSLDSSRWTPLDVAMTPLRDPVTLAATRVTARRTVSTAEARVRRAGGVFIGTEEIERTRPARTAELFRARRGVTLEDVNGMLRLISARGPRPNITDGGARPTPKVVSRDTTSGETDEPTHIVTGGTESCPLRIGVDGHMMPEDYQLDEVAVGDVVAVELYPSAAMIPVQFSSTHRGVHCGLAMIWTRTGIAHR